MNETWNESRTGTHRTRLLALVATAAAASAACMDAGDDGVTVAVVAIEEPIEVIVNGARPANDERPAAQPAASLGAPPLAAACPLRYFPIRGRHETGYQPSPSSDDPSIWSCEAAYSNSDYYTEPSCDGHLGNDIWAAEGTPVVATVSGTIVQAEFSSYSGNQVRIMDDCGWSHYAIHLQHIATGITVGARIEAGTLIGWVGKTGAANGVVHLHYSIYPGEDYCSGVDPWPYLNAVERNVCDGAPSDRCGVRDDGRLWCDNRAAAPVRADKSPSAAQVDVLRTTYSWFSCFGFGQRHHGGNDTWYFTIGDDSGSWGWVAAGDVQTTSELDADPAAHGLRACASQAPGR
jgi:murein DD-endopeptidase MepM/ murein hydrolase activator NlpD